MRRRDPDAPKPIRLTITLAEDLRAALEEERARYYQATGRIPSLTLMVQRMIRRGLEVSGDAD